MRNYYQLSPPVVRLAKRLRGPIAVFGGGGFIGANLLRSLLLYRKDVFGVSRKLRDNWRLRASRIPASHLYQCDVTRASQLRDLISELKPQTIFNLAAYGGYAKQKEYTRIYRTNYTAVVDLLEELKRFRFAAYIHAGSSSEYGTNCKAPHETDELVPNSHYAVSKVAVSFAIKYYGKIENLPVLHLRLYSVYGPWEEPDRLIPALLSQAQRGTYPKLVDPEISRDFVYITDVTSAFIIAAGKVKREMYGEVFNVASGRKTTIYDLAMMVKKLLRIRHSPRFEGMKNRNWDLYDWYGNYDKIRSMLGWKPQVSLRDGLLKTLQWQRDIDYDAVYERWKHG